ncbi:SDR family oxidoreductase [Microbulbifer aggregans]|uniref:SDR family oxidoreductase n=1 Tax=Microbulbifer aggregans TaxID=1769779 RepID=UPI001CFD28F3|nr:SDR family oxidoreductase [Microbulbifer aggregans]
MKKILIIGATSSIAESVARLYAKQGDEIYLLARNQGRLDKIVNDLRVRGAADVHSAVFDVCDFDAHVSILDDVFDRLGEVDVVLLAHGTLPDQSLCENSAESALSEIKVNALSSVSLLTHLANKMEYVGKGTIAVITSVAGDRGRKSNYVYGAAKAMLSAFLEGMRHRLFSKGVVVLDIRPGFVDTPMTKDFAKGVLWAKPEKVAEGIVRAISTKKSVVYLPFFWAGIMGVVRNLPRFIFLRTSL